MKQNFYVDDYFHIGQTHLSSGKPCQDYSFSGVINKGAFADEISKEKTELTAEDLKELEAERKKLAEEIEKRKGEFLANAKAIIESMAGKARGEIKAKLVEAGIPAKIIEELLPAATAAAPGESWKAGAQQQPAATKKEEKK